MDKTKLDARWLKIALAVAGAILLCVLFWQQLGLIVSVVLTGAVLSFLLAPALELFRRIGIRRRGLQVALSFLVVICVIVGLVLLLVPPLVGQIKELSRLMARSVQQIQRMLLDLNRFLAARGIPPLELSRVDWSFLSGGLMGVLDGTRSAAGGVISWFTRFGFSLMLAFYFLLYKERVLLSLELMIPASWRKLALQMGGSVTRELRQYVRGQLTIAVIVGVLAFLGLLLVGAPTPVLLGSIVGLFNLIPYFGPLIGGIPAVLMALGKGLTTAVLSALVLFVVQQLDGFLISPRVMSGMTGISPMVVLLAIAVGSSLSGIWGMFFAIPVVLIVRICLRVWASRNEMIEKCPEL